MARLDVSKIWEDKVRKAMKAIKDPSQSAPLGDYELYVYSVAMLIVDGDGMATDEEVIEATKNPAISSMAELAVSMARSLDSRSVGEIS